MKFYTAILLCIASLTTFGCVKSGAPEVEELIKINPPTFMGTNVNLADGKSVITVANQNFNLLGVCDQQAYSTEFSITRKARAL